MRGARPKSEHDERFPVLPAQIRIKMIVLLWCTVTGSGELNLQALVRDVRSAKSWKIAARVR